VEQRLGAPLEILARSTSAACCALDGEGSTGSASGSVLPTGTLKGNSMTDEIRRRLDLVRKFDKSITIKAADDQSVAESSRLDAQQFAQLWAEVLAHLQSKKGT